MTLWSWEEGDVVFKYSPEISTPLDTDYLLIRVHSSVGPLTNTNKIKMFAWDGFSIEPNNFKKNDWEYEVSKEIEEIVWTLLPIEEVEVTCEECSNTFKAVSYSEARQFHDEHERRHG